MMTVLMYNDGIIIIIIIIVEYATFMKLSRNMNFHSNMQKYEKKKLTIESTAHYETSIFRYL